MKQRNSPSKKLHLKYFEGEGTPIIKIGSSYKALSTSFGNIDFIINISKNEIFNDVFKSKLLELSNTLEISWSQFQLYHIVRYEQKVIKTEISSEIKKNLLQDRNSFHIAYGKFLNSEIVLFEKPGPNGKTRIIGFGKKRTIRFNNYTKCINKRSKYWFDFLLSFENATEKIHNFVSKIGFTYL